MQIWLDMRSGDKKRGGQIGKETHTGRQTSVLRTLGPQRHVRHNKKQENHLIPIPEATLLPLNPSWPSVQEGGYVLESCFLLYNEFDLGYWYEKW